MKTVFCAMIALFKSVIAGPVNCTYAFNYWTVTGAAYKHAAQQLVTML